MLHAATNRKPNKLIHEKSPYLQQHAYNPVAWYPWGKEAFQKARKENKPVFLSIGYSTCHWCHVMEQESFSNTDIAEIMNNNFVNIKVDREERPDIDTIYMTAVQAMTGSAGWPLNIWLSPDLDPILGGTYFPPESRYGIAGFPEMLERVSTLWKNRRENIISSSAKLKQQLKQYVEITAGKESLTNDIFEQTVSQYQNIYDRKYGGFGDAPKFPMPSNLFFLLSSGNATGRSMACDTLKAMARGGIHDHIGGGFHRYSTDGQWFLPHFEKMLYDNAQLAVCYAQAYQITDDREFSAAGRGILNYVLRDMTHAEGGFFSAEDADSTAQDSSDKKEGAFYMWSKNEIAAVLGEETGSDVSAYFNVQEEGNVEQDLHQEFKNKNILFITTQPDTAMERYKEKLLAEQGKRARPERDEKIITSWNGLMISAFCQGARAFGDETYAQAAADAASFVQKNLYDSTKKKLFRRWCNGDAGVGALSEDYAFFIQGLIDLYETTFNAAWLQWAKELIDQHITRYYDARTGGFYQTAEDQDEYLILRIKDTADTVIPGSSSVAALNLLRLAQYLGIKEYRDYAGQTFTFFSKEINRHPTAYPFMLHALKFFQAKPVQIIIAGDIQDPATKNMITLIHKKFIPHSIFMLLDNGKNREYLAQCQPFLNEYLSIDNKPTAYICVNFTCSLPTTDPHKINALLQEYIRFK